MSYTDSTTHYHWPLPQESDLFNGLDDNTMKEELDEKIYTLEQTSQDDHATVVQLAADVQELGQTVAGYDQTIESIQGTLTEHAERLILLTNRQTELSRQLGTKAGEATIAEAYNEEAGYHIGEIVYHSNILYEANVTIVAPAGEFDSSKWDIVTLADKVEENTSASGISYDNVSSGLTADDVQEAIDELNTNLTGLKKHTAGTDHELTAQERQGYIAPSDGYIKAVVSSSDASANYGAVLIDNEVLINIRTVAAQTQSVFVREGSTIKAGGEGTTINDHYYFVPLV